MVTTILISNKEITFAYLGPFCYWTHIMHTLLCLTSLVQYYFCKIYPCCWSSLFLIPIQYSVKRTYHDIFSNLSQMIYLSYFSQGAMCCHGHFCVSLLVKYTCTFLLVYAWKWRYWIIKYVFFYLQQTMLNSFPKWLYQSPCPPAHR